MFKYSSFQDVLKKAKRILSSGGVSGFKQFDKGRIIGCYVEGDTGDYEVYLFRPNYPKSKAILRADCECKWSEWSSKRETYYKRMCSHELAALLKLYKTYQKARDNDPLNLASPDGSSKWQ